jgi:uncharacterized membrane protein
MTQPSLIVDNPRVDHSISEEFLSVAPKRREPCIDIVRGLAVFCMIAANLAGSILQEPHPFLFRFYGTFAASTFILLSGVMVGFNQNKAQHDLKYYLTRAALILSVASAIDIFIWQQCPFMSFDVLYLIGAALPLAYLASKLPGPARWTVTSFFFLLVPLFQYYFGYQLNDIDHPLHQYPMLSLFRHSTSIAKRFFIDGWFPLFPWAGFSLLGMNLGSLWKKHGEAFFSALKRYSLPILLIGIAVWMNSPGPLYTRAGYSELFYPPTLGYCLTAIGVALTVMSLVQKSQYSNLWKPWQYLGQCSLLIYILHYAIIRFVFEAAWPHVPFPTFIVLYALFAISLIGVAYGIHQWKTHYPPQQFLLKFLLGG